MLIIAACADDRFGLRFNHRRQSRDRAVTEDLLANFAPIRIHPDSADLFGLENNVKADNAFLSLALDEDLCFVEDDSYLNHLDQISKIILYRWNRTYPRDMIFKFPGKWDLVESITLAGYSHETITREVYVR